jgi:hypothetical protein
MKSTPIVGTRAKTNGLPAVVFLFADWTHRLRSHTG